MKDVVIIGGGLAGLASAIQLSKSGMKVKLIERKCYPFHRVCGEYLSTETIPFLRSLGFNWIEHNASQIEELHLTTYTGNSLHAVLASGGIGISRYKLDQFLFEKAKEAGTEFLLNTHVTDVKEEKEGFRVFVSQGKCIDTKLVIGSYGKRSNLDRQLERKFFYMRSPYVGVKYHIKTDLPDNIMSLHNFPNGYCGIVKIEDDKYCMCYMASRDDLKRLGTIEALEQNVLFRNSNLKKIFERSEFLFEKPETINEISFEKKGPLEDKILMCGDAAGMIAPLSGNGMAMALHSSKVLCDIIIKNKADFKKISREYSNAWNSHFSRRINSGRFLQRILLNGAMTELTVGLLKTSDTLKHWVIRQTHGKPF